ncbi:MAG TPA: hypothetical protein VGM56_30210, partial [Byssovorax sp.]
DRVGPAHVAEGEARLRADLGATRLLVCDDGAGTHFNLVGRHLQWLEGWIDSTLAGAPPAACR